MTHKHYPEIEAISALDAEYARIADAVTEAQGAAIEARDKLPKAKAQLAETILRAALGEAKESDVSAARFAIVYAERDIESAELIIEPARKTQAGIAGNRYKLSLRLGYRKELDELKNNIISAGCATEVQKERLRYVSGSLNMDPASVDTFLASLKPQAA